MTSGWSDHPSRPHGPGRIAELRAYWEALRDSDTPPRRDRIDPRGLAGALEHSFLVERIAPGIARFRIAGTAYTDLMGMDVRGMPLSCLFQTEARDRLPLDLERVFGTPSILTLDLRADPGLIRAGLSGRMQILPLLDIGGACTLAIGCLDLTGTIGRVPRRFAIADVRHEALTGTSCIPSQAARPARAAPGVPYLRLVKA